MNKLLKITLTASVLLVLTACSYLHTDTKPVNEQDSVCIALKRQYYYNHMNPNPEANWVAKTQRQRLQQQLLDHHCL